MLNMAEPGVINTDQKKIQNFSFHGLKKMFPHIPRLGGNPE